MDSITNHLYLFIYCFNVFSLSYLTVYFSLLTVTFENRHAYSVYSNGNIIPSTPRGPNNFEPTDIYVALCGDKDEEGNDNENGNILVFSSNAEDISKSYTVIQSYGNIKEISYGYTGAGYDSPEWRNVYRYTDYNDIRKVVFLNEIVPKNTTGWFDNLTMISEIENISNLNTSKVTDMAGMFDGATSLTTIYVSNDFVVTNVSSSDYMFSMCNSLEGEKVTTYVNSLDEYGNEVESKSSRFTCFLAFKKKIIFVS